MGFLDFLIVLVCILALIEVENHVENRNWQDSIYRVFIELLIFVLIIGSQSRLGALLPSLKTEARSSKSGGLNGQGPSDNECQDNTCGARGLYRLLTKRSDMRGRTDGPLTESHWEVVLDRECHAVDVLRPFYSLHP